eukprot:6492081-Amphidinium_carterae.2
MSGGLPSQEPSSPARAPQSKRDLSQYREQRAWQQGVMFRTEHLTVGEACMIGLQQTATQECSTTASNSEYAAQQVMGIPNPTDMLR